MNKQKATQLIKFLLLVSLPIILVILIKIVLKLTALFILNTMIRDIINAVTIVALIILMFVAASKLDDR